MGCKACGKPSAVTCASGYAFCRGCATCKSCRMQMSNGELRQALLDNATAILGQRITDTAQAVEVLVSKNGPALSLYHHPNHRDLCRATLAERSGPTSPSSRPSVAG